MANDIGIPSSVTPSSLQSSSKSGQSAAQVLSGMAEEQRVTILDVEKQQEERAKDKVRKSDVSDNDIEKRYKTCRSSASCRDGP